MSNFNSSKYINDFAKKNYDRIILQVPKGEKSKIEEHRKAKGYKSLNSYLQGLIMQDMNR